MCDTEIEIEIEADKQRMVQKEDKEEDRYDVETVYNNTLVRTYPDIHIRTGVLLPPSERSAPLHPNNT